MEKGFLYRSIECKTPLSEGRGGKGPVGLHLPRAEGEGSSSLLFLEKESHTGEEEGTSNPHAGGESGMFFELKKRTSATLCHGRGRGGKEVPGRGSRREEPFSLVMEKKKGGGPNISIRKCPCQLPKAQHRPRRIKQGMLDWPLAK